VNLNKVDTKYMVMKLR